MRLACSPAGQYGNWIIHQDGLEGSTALWELGLEQSGFTWFHDDGSSDYVVLHYLGVENVMSIKKQPTGIIQWHKRDTAGLNFSSFFFKSKAVGSLWCWSLYKSNILSEKNYTTSNYILWRSKAANSVQNRIKARLVWTHHMRLSCMPSLTVCSVRAAAEMTILH